MKHQPRKDLKWWGNVLKSRANSREEALPTKSFNKIHLDDKNATLVFLGDLHLGSQFTNYDHIFKTVEYIKKTKGVYALSFGDLFNGIFFGGQSQGQDIANIPEQHLVAHEILKELSPKLLGLWGGDHDTWDMNKMGSGFYENFEDEYGIPYFEGISYLEIHVRKQVYRLAGSHRFKGFSLTNSTQAAIRVAGLSVGCDLAVCAHSHTKGIYQSVVKEFGGQARPIYYFSLGAEKVTDNYAKKLGFPPLSPLEMGPSGVTLGGVEREIMPRWEMNPNEKS